MKLGTGHQGLGLRAVRHLRRLFQVEVEKIIIEAAGGGIGAGVGRRQRRRGVQGVDPHEGGAQGRGPVHHRHQVAEVADAPVAPTFQGVKGQVKAPEAPARRQAVRQIGPLRGHDQAGLPRLRKIAGLHPEVQVMVTPGQLPGKAQLQAVPETARHGATGRNCRPPEFFLPGQAWAGFGINGRLDLKRVGQVRRGGQEITGDFSRRGRRQDSRRLQKAAPGPQAAPGQLLPAALRLLPGNPHGAEQGLEGGQRGGVAAAGVVAVLRSNAADTSQGRDLRRCRVFGHMVPVKVGGRCPPLINCRRRPSPLGKRLDIKYIQKIQMLRGVFQGNHRLGLDAENYEEIQGGNFAG